MICEPLRRQWQEERLSNTLCEMAAAEVWHLHDSV